MRSETLHLLLEHLQHVKTSREFEDWVRIHLRRYVPHAAILGTFGRLYGVGSVPTHRLGVDFPLNLAEAMKDRFGAIDDPFVCEWFQTEKTRFVEFTGNNSDCAADEGWQVILRGHGVSSILVFGVLDRGSKRFALFQMLNPKEGGSLEMTRLVSELSGPLAKCCWQMFGSRAIASIRKSVGHPTISLTQTELQIVEFLAMGMSNKEIARRRGVSSSTVKTQVSRTGAKLGASRRSEMVAIGMSMLSMLPAQGSISYGDQE